MKTTIKYLILLISISSYAQLEETTTTYSYDNLNRLVQVIFNDGAEKNYVYDDLGNRIQLNTATPFSASTRRFVLKHKQKNTYRKCFFVCDHFIKQYTLHIAIYMIWFLVNPLIQKIKIYTNN